MKKEEKRKIDILFDRYLESHQHPTHKLIQWVCVPLIVFSIIGLVTAVPFPNIPFLGKYNMFINWFSFILAIAIYYYSTLSPLLSYLMLFFFGICYFFIVQLEYVERDGGPTLLQVSLVLFVIAWIGLFIGRKIEGRGVSLLDGLNSIAIGPIWLLQILLKKLNVSY